MLNSRESAISRRSVYEDDWMRYYPYHLDPEFDDEDGSPYDYGMGEEEDEWE